MERSDIPPSSLKNNITSGNKDFNRMKKKVNVCNFLEVLEKEHK